MIQFGLDRLLADPQLRRPLAGKRVALLAHPASVTRDLTHSLDALAEKKKKKINKKSKPKLTNIKQKDIKLNNKKEKTW